MNHAKFCIFDVDTRQPTDDGNGWTYQGRAVPFRSDTERLLEAVHAQQVPLVMTTCVGGHMLAPAQFKQAYPEMLFVPLDERDTAWAEKCAQYNAFYVEKLPRHAGCTAQHPHPAHEIFLNNKNAARLIDALGIQEWIVFGNAMETCVDLVIAKLREKQCTVRYIPELMMPGAKCTDCDKQPFKQRVYDSWATKDVSPIALDTVLKQIHGLAAIA